MVEYWDLYDKDGNKLYKTVKRGDKLNNDEYHLVVNVWIKNKNNEFLISQRSSTKAHPLMWEITGGSVLKGESSLDGALREVYEELGLKLNRNSAKFIGRANRYYPNCNDILDVWLFEIDDNNMNLISIQKEELNDAKWASIDEIKEINENDKFLVNPYFEKIINDVSCSIK